MIMDDNETIRSPETVANGLNGSSSDFSIVTGPPSGANGNIGPVDLSGVNLALYNSLQSHISDMSLEEAVGHVQALMKENQDLKVIVEQSNATMNQLSTSWFEWKKTQAADKEEVKKRLDQTKNVVLDLRSQKNELLEKVKTLESENEQFKNVADKITADELHRLEVENCKLREEKRRYERMIEEHREEAMELKRRLETTPLSLDQVTDSVNSDLESRLHSLKNKLDDAVMFKTKAETLEKECESFKQMAADLEVKLAEVRDTSVLLSDENKDLKKKDAHLRELIKDLEIQLNSMKQMNQRLEEEKRDLVILNSELQSQCKQQNPDKQDIVEMITDAMPDPYDLGSRQQRAQVQFSSNDASQVQELRDKNAQLSARISEQNTLIERLKSDLDKKEQQFQAASMRYINTMKELKQSHLLEMEGLSKENEKLSKELKGTTDLKNLLDDVGNLKAQNLSLVSELHEQESKKMAATKKVDTLRKRNEELEMQITELQKQLEQSYAMDNSVVQIYEQQLKVEKQNHATAKAQLSEVSGQYNTLCSNYNEQCRVIEELRKDQARLSQMTMPPSYNEDVFRHFQEKVDNLTGQIMTAEETIHSKNAEIHALKDRLSRRATEIETLPVLQAQCEIYKADFEAEREAREKQHSENCRMQAEIQQLQIRNQQLQDEMENYSKKQLQDMQRSYARQSWTLPNTSNTNRGAVQRISYPHDFDLVADGNQMGAYGMTGTTGTRNPSDAHVKPRSPESKGRPIQEPEADLICPKCGTECPEMDSLTIHVLDCLEH